MRVEDKNWPHLDFCLCCTVHFIVKVLNVKVLAVKTKYNRAVCSDVATKI